MDRDGAIKLLEAARAVGARRYVMISSVGAESPPAGDEPFSVYLQAKAAADAAVAASDRVDDRAPGTPDRRARDGPRPLQADHSVARSRATTWRRCSPRCCTSRAPPGRRLRQRRRRPGRRRAGGGAQPVVTQIEQVWANASGRRSRDLDERRRARVALDLVDAAGEVLQLVGCEAEVRRVGRRERQAQAVALGDLARTSGTPRCRSA